MSMFQTGTTQYLLNQVALSNSMRSIWVNNNQWIRELIFSILFDIGDRDAIEARLRQNAEDFSAIFTQFYGQEIGARIRQNYLSYIQGISALLEAFRNNDPSGIANQRRILYDAADQLAQTLSEINRYWDRATLQAQIHELVNFAENEILRITGGDYAESIREYDEWMEQTYHFADDLASGILRQFHI